MGLNFYTIFGATDQRIDIWCSSLTLTLCHNWGKNRDTFLQLFYRTPLHLYHDGCNDVFSIQPSSWSDQRQKRISSWWCVRKRFSLMVHLFTSNVNYKAIQRLKSDHSLVSWANGKLRPTGAEFFVGSIETTNVELHLRLSTFVQVLFSHSQKCFIQMVKRDCVFKFWFETHFKSFSRKQRVVKKIENSFRATQFSSF